MNEETVRLNGQEAIPYIVNDGRVVLIPRSLIGDFAHDLHFLVAESWEGGEEEDEESPT